MKQLIVFLFFVMLPMMVMGVPLTSMVKDVEAEQKQSEIDPAIIDALAERLSKDFIKTEPELVKFIGEARKNYSLRDSARSDILTGFAKFVDLLSYKVFNSIKDEQIALLEANKKLTGREIKKIEGDGITVMLLDRGSILESKDCNPDFNLCAGDNETLKCYEEQSQKFCNYPDGFEEHELVIEDFENDKGISALIDSKVDNVHLFVDVACTRIVSDNNIDNTFEYVEQTSDYNEEAEWRNITMAALRKGEYIHASYCWKYRDKPECKKYLDYSIYYPADKYAPTTIVEKSFLDYSKQLDGKKLVDKKKKVSLETMLH